MADKEVNETWKWLMDLRKAGAKAHSKVVAEAELNLAFLSGNQWVTYDMGKGLVPLSGSEDYVTDNRVLPSFKRALADLFQSDPAVTVFEGGIELADSEAAKAAAIICDYWQTNNGWKQARVEEAGWMLAAGFGCIAPVWRENGGRKREVTVQRVKDSPEKDERGKVTYLDDIKVTQYDGDIAFEFYNPLQTYFFPIKAQSWNKVTSIMTVDLLTAEQIKDQIDPEINFGSLEKVDAKAVDLDALDRINQFVSAEFGYASNDPDHIEEMYLVMQYFGRASKLSNNGRYILAIGGSIIRDGELPYVEEARVVDPTDSHNITMGVIPWMSMNFPGRLKPPAPMSAWRDPQRRINSTLTDEDENRKSAVRNKLLTPYGLIGDDQWSDEHAEIIPVDPGAMAFTPQWVQAPPLQGVQQAMANAERGLDEATGQVPITRGINDNNVRAAWHADMLMQAAKGGMWIEFENAELSLTLTAKLALAIAQRRYDLERMEAIVGRDRARYAQQFYRALIPTDVRIKRGSMMSRNHAVREQKLMELLQYGLFNEETGRPGPTTRREFLKLSELGTLNATISDEDLQRNRAQDEFRKMMLNPDAAIKPWEHENHMLHIEEHTKDTFRPEWYVASEKVQLATLSHIDEHENMLKGQVAPGGLSVAPPQAAGGGAGPNPARAIQPPARPPVAY